MDELFVKDSLSSIMKFIEELLINLTIYVFIESRVI